MGRLARTVSFAAGSTLLATLVFLAVLPTPFSFSGCILLCDEVTPVFFPLPVHPWHPRLEHARVFGSCEHCLWFLPRMPLPHHASLPFIWPTVLLFHNLFPLLPGSILLQRRRLRRAAASHSFKIHCLLVPSSSTPKPSTLVGRFARMRTSICAPERSSWFPCIQRTLGLLVRKVPPCFL